MDATYLMTHATNTVYTAALIEYFLGPYTVIRSWLEKLDFDKQHAGTAHNGNHSFDITSSPYESVWCAM